MQLQAVALALAIGHHQHDDVSLRVDKAARRLLVVDLALEQIRGRRRDDVQPFDGLPIAELGRQTLVDIEHVVRARHQFVRRHHDREQHRRQHRGAGEENIGRTRHIRLRFARSFARERCKHSRWARSAQRPRRRPLGGEKGRSRGLIRPKSCSGRPPSMSLDLPGGRNWGRRESFGRRRPREREKTDEAKPMTSEDVLERAGFDHGGAWGRLALRPLADRRRRDRPHPGDAA